MFTLLVSVQKCFFSTLDQVGLLGGLDDHKQFWVERFYCISDFFSDDSSYRNYISDLSYFKDLKIGMKK